MPFQEPALPPNSATSQLAVGTPDELNLSLRESPPPPPFLSPVSSLLPTTTPPPSLEDLQGNWMAGISRSKSVSRVHALAELTGGSVPPEPEYFTPFINPTPATATDTDTVIERDRRLARLLMMQKLRARVNNTNTEAKSGAEEVFTAPAILEREWEKKKRRRGSHRRSGSTSPTTNQTTDGRDFSSVKTTPATAYFLFPPPQPTPPAPLHQLSDADVQIQEEQQRAFYQHQRGGPFVEDKPPALHDEEEPVQPILAPRVSPSLTQEAAPERSTDGAEQSDAEKVFTAPAILKREKEKKKRRRISHLRSGSTSTTTNQTTDERDFSSAKTTPATALSLLPRKPSTILDPKTVLLRGELLSAVGTTVPSTKNQEQTDVLVNAPLVDPAILVFPSLPRTRKRPSVSRQRTRIQTDEFDEQRSVYGSPGFEDQAEQSDKFPGFRHAVAQSESTKDYSPTTENMVNNEMVLLDGDSLLKALLIMSPNRRSRGRARTGSDPPTIRGNMAAASLLERLKTEEPFRPAMPSSAEVTPQNDSSPPTAVQTVDKTEFALPSTASTIPRIRQRKVKKRECTSIPREALIETDLIEALHCLQVRPNFQEIVSTTNDWGQTLAHLAILYGYPSLLHSLVDWRINLTIADGNGFTALHYAYMKGDLDSVRILRRGGASEIVTDKLGQTPLDLQPEGFGASIDIDAKVAVELQ
jgi:hypothetical protein